MIIVGFFRRLLMVPSFIRGEMVAVRIGNGVGIEVYTASTNKGYLRTVAANFFKLSHGIN